MKGTFRPCIVVEPYEHTHYFRVKPKDKGETLIEFLCLRLPFHSELEWMKRIEAGNVRVNGSNAHLQAPIKPFDLIEHYNPCVKEPSIPDEINILDETDDLLAVYKPAPMPVHPGGRYFKQTLTEQLKSRGFTDLFIVHRLDAVTSGIVMFAKSASVARNVSQLFQQNRVKKEYLALVEGIPNTEHWSVSLPIQRKMGYKFEVLAVGDSSNSSKAAYSEFYVHNVFPTGKSLIRCIPHTGRTHQLRLHLAASGLPIIGDETYQSDQSTTSFQRTGIALCHTRCAFPDLNIEFRCPLPFEWQQEFGMESEVEK